MRGRDQARQNAEASLGNSHRVQKPYTLKDCLQVDMLGLNRGGVQPFHQKSTCITQWTPGRYLAHIWSRYDKKIDPTKPAYHSRLE